MNGRNANHQFRSHVVPELESGMQYAQGMMEILWISIIVLIS